ncbi:MAG: hypothetical protein C4527_19995 [Candidatus Omnitrophota bacterium]|nr:MAG: hypothetical protein C4527_19995 [Candidatus Omnitrophota bacterium]
MNVQLLALGFLQPLAARFPLSIWAESKCWLRTYTSDTPSEFVTRTAFTNIFRRILFRFGNETLLLPPLDPTP